MKNRRPKCFVAMAFGRDDCDLIYTRRILPTLRELKVTPIRVDRRQHRDDLNNFIIRMLKESDIVLADLTYARPSVYYEAGFAERFSPIVYTARSDHLSRAQPDDRLRVHFDLEMKKIVAWKSPEDQTFAARLRSRIAYLLQPILAGNAEKQRLLAARQRFSKLSVTDRCKWIAGQFTRELSKKRFWLRALFDIDRAVQWEINPARAIVGAKMVGRVAVSATVVTAESITRKQIQTVLNRATGSALIGRGHRDNISLFDEHIYFCALSRIPTSRLTAAFPHATPHDRPGCFRISQIHRIYERKFEKTIWLVGSIDSERMATEASHDSLRKLSGQKTNAYTSIVMDGVTNRGRIVFERPRKPNHEVHRIPHPRRVRKR
jgi:nucleoside 2-deoxyribosyltransferase